MTDGQQTADSEGKPGIIRRWWKLRGGFKDLFTSWYFWMSVALLIPTSGTWRSDGWWDVPIGVLPNVLGFSLGGYAILLAFGDDGFRRLLVPGVKPEEGSGRATLYIQVSAIFLHFILVQLIALVGAIVARGMATIPAIEGTPEWLPQLGCAISYFLFLYAILLAAAAALSVFKLSEWFEAYLKSQHRHQRTTAAPEQDPKSGSGAA